MLSKAQVKDIRLLSTAKGRQEARAFIAEGDKIVREWLQAGAPVQLLVGTREWLDANRSLLRSVSVETVVTASAEDLSRISSLRSTQDVLLIAAIPEPTANLPTAEWTLVLDDIQDPGNVGTLIRIADWFGIRHIVASPGSADFYNSKVVQAAMGGHLRVQLHTAALRLFLSSVQVPIIAATLGGEDIYKFSSPEKAILIIGNEGRGIKDEILSLADYKVTIPKKGGAESLNAGVSAGILCALLMR